VEVKKLDVLDKVIRGKDLKEFLQIIILI